MTPYSLRIWGRCRSCCVRQSVSKRCSCTVVVPSPGVPRVLLGCDGARGLASSMDDIDVWSPDDKTRSGEERFLSARLVWQPAEQRVCGLAGERRASLRGQKEAGGACLCNSWGHSAAFTGASGADMGPTVTSLAEMRGASRQASLAGTCVFQDLTWSSRGPSALETGLQPRVDCSCGSACSRCRAGYGELLTADGSQCAAFPSRSSDLGLPPI